MDDNIQSGASVAEALPNWQAPLPPTPQVHSGQYCTLEPISAEKHSDALWQAFSLDRDNQLWAYLPYGPFAQKEALYTFLMSRSRIDGEQYYAVLDQKTGEAIGFLAYLRINAKAGSIEIGGLCFSPRLQKTTMATEAVYLLIQHCFELGYRRCEWKCNALNAPSKQAALRFGFQYEGCFRQAMVVKGYNRDTAWYSIIDKEWPQLNRAYCQWLKANNFDASGNQIKALGYFIENTLIESTFNK